MTGIFWPLCLDRVNWSAKFRGGGLWPPSSYTSESLDQSISRIILNFIFGGFQPLDPTVRQCVLSHFGSKEHGRAFASVGLLAAEVLKSVRAGPLREDGCM